jgi:4-amino-4-deoxy-L-arabinose transferase-like glycosyltransferase
LVAVLPLATLGLVLATPDAPLFAATALAMVGVERALAAPPRSARALGWWGATGVALGGAFVAKYMAVLLPAGLVLACLVHPALRRRFAEPGPWVASAVALALFAPVVWWNATHDWVSFRFQLGHGFSGTPRGTPLGRELELLGGQAGLASPLLFGLLAMAVGSALRAGWRSRHTDAPTAPAVRRFALAMVAVVPLAFFAVSAWRRSPEANWPAMLYPAAMALLATATAPWATGRWWRAGVALAAGLTMVAMAQAWRPLLPLAAPRDPIARAHGWSALAEAVQEARRVAASTGAAWPAVAANRYQEAAVLAFLLPDRPRVLALNLQSRPNQYDLWPGGDQVVRRGDGLVAVFQATPREDSLARAVGIAFADARPVATVSLRRAAGEITTRRIWLYTDRRGALPRSAPGAAAAAPVGVGAGASAGSPP